MKIFTAVFLLIFTLKASAQTKIPAKDASKYIGKTVTICDKVYNERVISYSNSSYLNVGGYYPKQLLTVIVDRSDVSKNWKPLEIDFIDVQICVTGKVVDAQGKPEIVVTDPNQIKIN
jgi:hypothetical protein